jgi:GDP/UDP-N,N'-diacetylbacillosamine 2-epimerase (hydrolysing)
VRSAPRLTVHRNIVARDFWGLMARAAVLVGNSSAGLIETPYFPIPAINLGERQKGRLHAENVIHAEFGKKNVSAALTRALDDHAFAATVAKCSRPFGDGQAYRRIVNRLKHVELDERLLNKTMTY